MYLSQLLTGGARALSFEVFPPKLSHDYSTVETAVAQIAALSPAFVSVTCGAGGSNAVLGERLAASVQKRFNVPALSHMTCVHATREGVQAHLRALRGAGICNILAMRGDLPAGYSHGDFRYASDLVTEIKAFGGFCIGGACYPEGHIEAASLTQDLAHIREKADAGCEFLITQMFFENEILYRYRDMLARHGVFVPLVAGIMPVTNARQITRICALSGTRLPSKFLCLIERFENDPAAMQQAGIIYAAGQIIDLFANGIDAVHVYSMNKPEVAKSIKENISRILESPQ
ncbi:MAG: methylenetetrahydrofolate reductase [Clostridiales bacterium]|nr:methylenetetrahydrofolate reductase [Clostridiales bacterium]